MPHIENRKPCGGVQILFGIDRIHSVETSLEDLTSTKAQVLHQNHKPHCVLVIPAIQYSLVLHSFDFIKKKKKSVQKTLL